MALRRWIAFLIIEGVIYYQLVMSYSGLTNSLFGTWLLIKSMSCALNLLDNPD